jgi:hypothetical protein
VYSVDQPLREVHFEGEITEGDVAAGLPSYVTASNATVKKLTQQFLGVEDTEGPRGDGGALRPKKAPAGADRDGGLFKDPGSGKELAVRTIQKAKRKDAGRLPIYYPTVFLKGASADQAPRNYRIKTPQGKVERAYRMPVRGEIAGDYYGIQGTTWKNPPILASEQAEERTQGGRTFELHYDGDRVRLVAWRTSKAVYWVSNTLRQTLTERQMLAIARSTRLP